jgi:hypothetical protein
MKTSIKIPEDEILNKLLTDAEVRRAVTRQSHKWFFSVFLSEYIQYELALFHEDMFALSENNEKLSVIMAFRGSGKSTIMNLSYAIWSILGVQQKKFVVIVSKTQSQAKNHLQNIRDELEHNALLKQDLGPFQADDSNWGASSIVLTKMNARIMAVSREQATRGLRYGAHRPDLIICDDLEDQSSYANKKEREETYQWLLNEVLPMGDVDTKVLVLGNLLGEHSLLMKLQKDIQQNNLNGVFRAYPLLDDFEEVMWPGKFDTSEKIKDLKTNVPTRILWDQEYLLGYTPENYLGALSKASRDSKAGLDSSNISSTYALGKYRIGAPRLVFNLGWTSNLWRE